MSNICDSCLLAKALCTCPDEIYAAQPTAALAPAPPDTSTTCTGYINGRGQIDHTENCDLHRWRKPVPGAWECPALTDEYGDGDTERCSSSGFTITGVIEIDTTVDGYAYVETAGGTLSINDIDYDTYDADYEVRDFEYIESIACADYEHEFGPGEPGFDEAVALWQKTRE